MNLKQLLRKYKSVFLFVLLFLGSYLLLTLLYTAYLKYSEGGSFYPDFITNLVARQSSFLLNLLSFKAAVFPDTAEPLMRLYIEEFYLAKIVEGCNSISVIILFSSFIFSFAEGFKKTLIFIFVGSVVIYLSNLARIVILSIALYHYPEYEHILHTIIFPAIIYGMTFLLWLYWIKMLPKAASKTYE